MATGRNAAGSQRSPRGPIENCCTRVSPGSSLRTDLHAAVTLRASGPLAALVTRVLVERGDAPVVGLVGATVNSSWSSTSSSFFPMSMNGASDGR
jgi:hypothetical protein